MAAVQNKTKKNRDLPARNKAPNEKLIVVGVIILTLLSAASALFIVTNLDGSITLPGLSSDRQYYSQPITVLTQSAPDSNGRNAYVKMTLIASSANRSTARALDNQEAIVKSTVTQVLQHHSPESLLEPSQLTLIQQSMVEALLQSLNISIDGIYFDRITVQ